MASPQPRPTRLSVTELPFYVFLVTLGLCLFRAADLPSLDIGVGGTTLSIGPADPALLITAVLAVRRALAPPQSSFPLAAAAAIAAFAVLIVRQRDPELGRRRHGGGQAVRLRRARARSRRVHRHAAAIRRPRLVPRRLLHRGGRLGRGRVRRQRRQAAGVVHGRARPGRPLDDGARARARVPLRRATGGRRRSRSSGIVVGALGIVLGASLASVLGLYIAAVAMIALALRRRDLRRRAVVVTVADLRRS